MKPFIRSILVSWLAVLPLAVIAGESYAWTPFDIRGMGFVTGVMVNPLPPHRVWIRTDVGGAYGYDRGQDRWRFASGTVAQSGLESHAVDPEVADSYLVAGQGEVWRTLDAGATWAPTGLASHGVMMNGNGDRRRAGERLQVDSAGSVTVLWYGSRNHGLWRKIGAAAWAAVPGLPAGTPDLGITTVLIDDASAAGQPSARTIHAGIAGNGVWRSSDGGATWAAVAGGPAIAQEPIRMVRATDGMVYLTCKNIGDDYTVAAGSVWRLSGTTWTLITPAAAAATSFGPLTLDPRDPARVLVATYGSAPSNWIFRSDDRGATWTAVPMGTPTVPASWTSWHLWGWSGGMAIDLASPDRLFITTGYGVLATDAHRAVAPAWRAPMQGVEELVGMHIRSLPASAGNRLIAGTQDMIGYTLDPAAPGPFGPSWKPDTFGICTGIDWCQSDPGTVVWVGSNETGQTPYAGLSRDGGQSWQPLSNPAPAKSYQGVWDGNIAVASDDRDSFVHVPMTAAWADNGKGPPGIWYTRDAGATWRQATGLPDRIPPLDQHWFPSEVLVSDRVLAGTFYLVSSNDDLGRVWRSSDYGASWTLMASSAAGAPLHRWSWKVKMRAVPGRAGEIWICYASENGGSELLLRSQDGGATWTEVVAVDKAWSLAFGAPAPGKTFPTLILHARIGGVTAIWRSDDALGFPGAAGGATFVEVSNQDAPTWPETVTQVEGDPERFGVIYLAGGGRGIWMGQRVGNTPPSFANPTVAHPGLLSLP